MKSMTNIITAILEKMDDKSLNIENQEEKLTDISSKLSTYEYHMDKVNINEMLQILPLQFNNPQVEKITDISSKLSTYKYRLEKLSITETHIQPMSF